MRLALVLLAVSSIAYADNKERIERKPCVCAPPKSAKPTLLVEVRWQSGSRKVVSKLFSTGMWTRQLTDYDGHTTSSGGKLDGALFDDATTALKSARWKVGKPPASCKPGLGDTTEFYVAGHKRYTQSGCGGVVDLETQKLIKSLDKRIQFAQPEDFEEEISVTTP